MEKYKYLFGPVSSRRLGRSLGVDLVPHKTCSLNCVYCECGLTTDLTLDRDEFVPTNEVLAELEHLLSQSPEIDFITFSGAGEPTLHSGLLKIANFIKTKYPQYKTCLLTNSTTLTSPDFFDELTTTYPNAIDRLVPSYDAVSEDAFEKINQPLTNLTANEVTEALIRLSHIFNGEIWLEIFFISGVNDTDAELELFVQKLNQMKLKKVQLNCLDRPAPYDWVHPMTVEEMNHIKEKLADLNHEIEVIGKVCYTQTGQTPQNRLTQVEELISRRPCTLEDIAQALGSDTRYAELCLKSLEQKGLKIETQQMQRGTFYRISKA